MSLRTIESRLAKTWPSNPFRLPILHDEIERSLSLGKLKAQVRHLLMFAFSTVFFLSSFGAVGVLLFGSEGGGIMFFSSELSKVNDVSSGSLLDYKFLKLYTLSVFSYKFLTLGRFKIGKYFITR